MGPGGTALAQPRNISINLTEGVQRGPVPGKPGVPHTTHTSGCHLCSVCRGQLPPPENRGHPAHPHPPPRSQPALAGEPSRPAPVLTPTALRPNHHGHVCAWLECPPLGNRMQLSHPSTSSLLPGSHHLPKRLTCRWPLFRGALCVPAPQEPTTDPARMSTEWAEARPGRRVQGLPRPSPLRPPAPHPHPAIPESPETADAEGAATTLSRGLTRRPQAAW